MCAKFLIEIIFHRYFKFILISFLLTLNSGLYLIHAQVNPVLSETLQKTLDSLKTRYNHIGISAAVVMPDKSEWTGASGMSDPDTQSALSSDMLFSMGSNTKTFVSAIIL